MNSVINIAGLAAGMAVTTLIGLWIWDELSFNRSHEHYDHIASVIQYGRLVNGGVRVGGVIAFADGGGDGEGLWGRF